jgi:hypothetical protein
VGKRQPRAGADLDDSAREVRDELPAPLIVAAHKLGPSSPSCSTVACEAFMLLLLYGV